MPTQNMTINKVREKILDLLYFNKNFELSRSKMMEKLKLTDEEMDCFRPALKNLQDNKLLVNVKGRFSAITNLNIGYLQTFEKKMNYIYFNNKKYLTEKIENLHILHGDKVIFEITDKHMLKANVVSIIKRKNTKFIGTYVYYNNIGFVVPDNNKLDSDIYISESKIKATSYDRVLVTIDSYKIFGKPEGIIEKQIFIDSDKEGSYLERVINKYDIEVEFPAEVVSKATKVNIAVNNAQVKERVDLRDEHIFTIDGCDAKDLDDAISIEKTEDGFILGVYIADVTYYVKEYETIDKNAFKRGTSHYLNNYVVPMLPTALSNGACSLTPFQDKLTVGMKLLIDKNGTVKEKSFFEAVINSKRKFTYEEINLHLEGKNDGLVSEIGDLYESITVGLELAKILRKRRMDRGCIDFESEEVRILKTESEILGFEPYKRGPANKMIEEFMLIANESVATLINEIGHPFIYRTHEEPFTERLEGFFEVCKDMGIELPEYDINEVRNKDLQMIVDSVSGSPDIKRALNMNLITTMKQAKYTSSSGLHFGLSTENYCHFTSPIRRYPDLFIHRILKKYIRKTLNNDVTYSIYLKSSEKVAKHCCYTERNANKAEEELMFLELMDYMSNNPENEYDGLIYGVNEKGFHVTISGMFSGFVRLDADSSDKVSITKGDKTYKIGERVKLTFREYEVKNIRIVFEVVEKNEK